LLINCSSGHRGALLAALIPGVNIIRMLLLGSGIWKDEATVKSMTRFGDRRFVTRVIWYPHCIDDRGESGLIGLHRLYLNNRSTDL